MPSIPVQHKARRALGLAVTMLAVAAAAACQGPTAITPSPTETVPKDMLPVRTLAHQLSLNVRSATPHIATLEDGRNYLLILGPPNASVSLNGRAINQRRIVSANGTLYVPASLAAQIRPRLNGPAPPAPRPLRRRRTPATVTGTVMLDAGHGGKDTGAPNRYGPDEKHITLDTTLRLERLLRSRGINTIMTRRDDSYPTLEQRSAMANRLRPRLFVSIHADSAPNRQARGFTVYSS